MECMGKRTVLRPKRVNKFFESLLESEGRQNLDIASYGTFALRATDHTHHNSEFVIETEPLTFMEGANSYQFPIRCSMNAPNFFFLLHIFYASLQSNIFCICYI